MASVTNNLHNVESIVTLEDNPEFFSNGSSENGNGNQSLVLNSRHYSHIIDAEDAFPMDGNEWLDTDGDGIGNNADDDDDGDGLSDHNTNPLDPDTDKDGVMDGDEVTGGGAKYTENCSKGDDNIDSDGDGIPDACDSFSFSADLSFLFCGFLMIFIFFFALLSSNNSANTVEITGGPEAFDFDYDDIDDLNDEELEGLTSSESSRSSANVDFDSGLTILNSEKKLVEMVLTDSSGTTFVNLKSGVGLTGHIVVIIDGGKPVYLTSAKGLLAKNTSSIGLGKFRSTKKVSLSPVHDNVTVSVEYKNGLIGFKFMRFEIRSMASENSFKLQHEL